MNKKPTQSQRILKELEKGGWMSGRDFLKMFITRGSARIFELKEDGYDIETSKHKDKYGFINYRLRV